MSASELNGHAAEAGLHEWTADARGVLALVNDRFLSVDSYVFDVRISRATAEALIATRNGTNGQNESRPEWWWPWPEGSSSGSNPPPVLVDAGSSNPPPVLVDGGSGPSYPPPPYRPQTWQLGGDDESFTRLSEIDALPGTDISAFKNLRAYARSHGYVPPSASDGGPIVIDGGPIWPPPPDGGSSTDAGGGGWPPPDASAVDGGW